MYHILAKKADKATLALAGSTVLLLIIVGSLLASPTTGTRTTVTAEPRTVTKTEVATVSTTATHTTQLPPSTTTAISTVTTTATSATTTTSTTTTTTTRTVGASWEVCYSPRSGCASLLSSWIDRANQTIHVMIYSFTRDDISATLVHAKHRGLEVKVVFDNQQVEVSGSEYSRLVSAGVEVRVDKRSGLMHNKVAIIDGRIVITGSYNWSAAADEINRENLIVLKDQTLAAKYEENFLAVWGAAQ